MGDPSLAAPLSPCRPTPMADFLPLAAIDKALSLHGLATPLDRALGRTVAALGAAFLLPLSRKMPISNGELGPPCTTGGTPLVGSASFLLPSGCTGRRGAPVPAVELRG